MSPWIFHFPDALLICGRERNRSDAGYNNRSFKVRGKAAIDGSLCPAIP
jgi:hypothetical protein